MLGDTALPDIFRIKSDIYLLCEFTGPGFDFHVHGLHLGLNIKDNNQMGQDRTGFGLDVNNPSVCID